MNLNKNKILVAATISSYKKYILPDFFNFIRTLTYKNYDIYLVDNSHDPTYHLEAKAMGFNCDHIRPGGRRIQEVMAESDEMIRLKAINEKYDYIMRIDCDVFLPRNIIECLLFFGAEIISAPYFFKFGSDSKMLYQTINYTGLNKVEARNLTFLEGFLKTTGDPDLVYGCGIGASLIHKSVLGKIKFRTVKGQNGFADSFLYQDLLRLGIDNYVDTSITSHHANRDWGGIYDYKDVDKNNSMFK